MNADSLAPLMQGLVQQSSRTGGSEVLPLIKNAYGVWNEVVTVDPSGDLVTNAAKSGAISAVIFGGVGYLVPGLTAVEGLKWGFITGAARAIFNHLRSS
jgi:hypothetical protein